MNFSTSNCVALGVPNAREAADHYKTVLGFEEAGSGGNWIEVRSGALRLFLCQDDVKVACMDMEVPDIEAAKTHLEPHGWTQVDIAPDEIFMRDPYGYHYCLSKSSACS